MTWSQHFSNRISKYFDVQMAERPDVAVLNDLFRSLAAAQAAGGSQKEREGLVGAVLDACNIPTYRLQFAHLQICRNSHFEVLSPLLTPPPPPTTHTRTPRANPFFNVLRDM